MGLLSAARPEVKAKCLTVAAWGILTPLALYVKLVIAGAMLETKDQSGEWGMVPGKLVGGWWISFHHLSPSLLRLKWT